MDGAQGHGLSATNRNESLSAVPRPAPALLKPPTTPSPYLQALLSQPCHPQPPSATISTPPPPPPIHPCSPTPPPAFNPNSDAFLPLDSSQLSPLFSKWHYSIICKLSTKSCSYDFLISKLQKIWATSSTTTFIRLGHGYLLCNPSSSAERHRILHYGPWFISGSFVWVQEWQPNFDPTKASITHYPVWAQIEGLPMEFRDTTLLTKIGNSIGSTTKVHCHPTNFTLLPRIQVLISLLTPPKEKNLGWKLILQNHLGRYS